jgi:hypothetical protein
MSDEVIKYYLNAGFWGQLLIFALLAGFAGWNVYLHSYEDRQARLTVSNDLRKPFFDKQFSLVFEAAEVTSALATSNNQEQWNQRRVRFWQMYWGELSVVENRELEGAMVQFGNALTGIREDFDKRSELGIPAINVAHAGRNLLEETWNLGLEPLGDDKKGIPSPKK